MAAQLRKKDSVRAAYVVEIECHRKQVYLARAALQVLNAIMLRTWSVLPAWQNPNLCEIRLVFSNFEMILQPSARQSLVAAAKTKTRANYELDTLHRRRLLDLLRFVRRGVLHHV